MKSFKRIALGAAVCSIMCLSVGTLFAQGQSRDRARQSQEKGDQAHLGIGVQSLSPALAQQLGDQLGKDQGVLIGDVEAGSPAAKAGVRKFDILTSFDDQKVYSTEQLIKLIHADKPGRTVTLQLIRHGKPLTVKATLGQQAARPLPQGPFAAEERRMMQHMMPLFREMVPVRTGGGHTDWESFDSMTMQKVGKDRFKVTIEYLDKQGKKQKHEFEGTRAEIHKAIQNEKDLPANERNHLLRSLDLQMPHFLIPSPESGIDLSRFFPEQPE